ncbi:MAG: hypothetical protein IKC32_04610 [Clostridia bacterium]|nr:hypothetical protein [Clostridia bacterium]
MSEAERIRRAQYLANRKKLILIQAVALVLVAILIIGSVFIYNKLNETYYINYYESSAVNYRVQMKPNDFYDSEWLPKDMAYVSTLVNAMEATFKYELDMDAANVDYEYSYRIDATVEISDKSTGTMIFSPSFVLKDETVMTQSSNNKLLIIETLPVDYVKYNELATSFTDTYDLASAVSFLKVAMTVNVIGSSDEFEADSENTYVVSLSAPLTNKTVEIQMTSSVPTGESKVLACKDAGSQEIFKALAIALSAFELLLLTAFVIFILLTKNHDVTYANTVARLYSSYSSFIQKLVGGFDTLGYQILTVETFRDMLAIRDTIQSPVLMSENTDKTRTQFFVPTNTKILYMFEVKIENYDELYGKGGYIDDSVIKTDEELKADEEKRAEQLAREAAEAEAQAFDIEEATRLVVEEARGRLGDSYGVPVAEAVERVVRESTPRVVADVIKEASLYIMELQGMQRGGGWGVMLPCQVPPCQFINGVKAEEHKPEEPVVEKPVAEPAEDKNELRASEAFGELVNRLLEKLEALGAVEKSEDKEEEPAEEPVVEPAPIIIAEEVVPEEVLDDVAEAIATEIEAVSESAESEDGEEDEVLIEVDEFGNRIVIHFSRSLSARLIQSPLNIKNYYSELKNYILSFKGVKSRMSWKHESFNKGRTKLFKLRIRGKTLMLYCALDPDGYEYSKYFHERVTSKAYLDTPMLVRIKSERALKRAKKLVSDVMEGIPLPPNPKAESVDYLKEIPYATTRELIDRSLIKVLDQNAVIKDELPTYETVKPVEESAPEEKKESAFPKVDAAVEAIAEAVKTTEEVTDAIYEAEAIDTDELPEDDDAWQSSGIKVSRSFEAKLCQLDGELKEFYSELKNYIMSFKGVKCKASWKYETYKHGKNQLVKLKLRGKMIIVYLAIDEGSGNFSQYTYEIIDSKAYSQVPFCVKIKNKKGINKVKELIDLIFEGLDVAKNPKYTEVDYASMYPHETNESLMDKGLLSILVDDKKVDIKDRRGFSVAKIVKAIISGEISPNLPAWELPKDPAYKGTKAKPAAEVVSVLIPDKDSGKDVYRYDPDGESLGRGDVILVPDVMPKSGRRTVRKAAVTEGNHGIDPEKTPGPFEKIIGTVKRKLEDLLSK